MSTFVLSDVEAPEFKRRRLLLQHGNPDDLWNIKHSVIRAPLPCQAQAAQAMMKCLNSKKPFCVCGPAGCGKTLLTTLCSRKAQYEPFFVDTSLKNWQADALSVQKTRTLGRRKMVVVDDMHLHWTAAAKLLKSGKAICLIFEDGCRNTEPACVKKLTHVRLPACPDVAIERMLRSACTQEKVSTGQWSDLCKKIAQKSRGNITSAFLSLQLSLTQPQLDSCDERDASLNVDIKTLVSTVTAIQTDHGMRCRALQDASVFSAVHATVFPQYGDKQISCSSLDRFASALSDVDLISRCGLSHTDIVAEHLRRGAKRFPAYRKPKAPSKTASKTAKQKKMEEILSRF